MANSSTRVLRSSSSKVAGDPTISGNALNVASVDEGSTSEEQDIDSLLKAATLALSGRAKPLLKTPEEHTGTQAVLIQGNHGVAHLNPEVLLAQNKIQAEAQASEKEKQTGTDWFAIKTPEMTEEIKRDLQLLKMRSILDPKRHYRKDNTKLKNLPKTFQMGTIISDSTESSAHKIRTKDQKQTIVDELLSDMTRREYFKRKTAEIDAKKRSGGRAFYNALKNRKAKKFTRK